MRALVTGSTGFIGRSLVERLVCGSWDVVCLVRQVTDRRLLRSFPVRIVQADYDDRTSLKRAVHDCDVVFHLGAALEARGFSAYMKANAEGTRRLAESTLSAGRGRKVFVYASSIAAAGPSATGSTKNEKDECRPVSLYGVSKLRGEEVLRRFDGRLPYVILRLPNVLGTDQPQLAAAARLIRKRIVPLLGTGRKQTSLCFVQDAARALVLAAERDRGWGETYFVNDGRAYAWREIVEPLAEILAPGCVLRLKTPTLLAAAWAIETAAQWTGRKPLVTREAIMSAGTYNWLFDGSKFCAATGFRAEVDFDEEIRRIARTYRQRAAS